MSDTRPIGIFDSGVGGLTVSEEVRRLLPSEDIVYFGDTARVPYGTKSKETVTKFSVENVEFLMENDVKLVVVACNTASSLSLEFMKRCFRVPIVGVIEPGVRCAAGITRNGRVGVIGTSATISSGAYEKAVRRVNPRIRVYAASCPLFVPLVEEGWTDKRVALDIASIYLKPLVNKVDTLILGCTHYPLLRDAIGKVMGRGTVLIDSAKEVAKEVEAVLNTGGLLNSKKSAARHRFFVSDEPANFIRMGERFLGRRINCVRRAV